jgi:tetratricopeptide (TPR) repeat protein
LARETGNYSLIIRHLSNLGTVYDRLGDWVGAEQFQREALSLADQMPPSRKNLRRQRIIRNSLAKSLKNQNRLHEAAKFLEENLASLGTDHDLQKEWLLFLQLGRIYRDLDNFNRATHYYRTALKITEMTGNQKGMSMCLRGLSKCYLANGTIDLAVDSLERAVAISEKIGDPYLSKLWDELQGISSSM